MGTRLRPKKIPVCSVRVGERASNLASRLDLYKPNFQMVVPPKENREAYELRDSHPQSFPFLVVAYQYAGKGEQLVVAVTSRNERINDEALEEFVERTGIELRTPQGDLGRTVPEIKRNMVHAFEDYEAHKRPE